MLASNEIVSAPPVLLAALIASRKVTAVWAGSSWLVHLLTNLALVPPGIFLADIGATGDPLPFLASLGLAVGLVTLVRASTTSET